MQVKRLIIVSLFWAGFVDGTLAAESDVSVRRVDSWGNLFAGKPTKIACEVASKQAGEATLLWSLVVSGGIIARGEKAVSLDVDRAVNVAWEVDLPDVKAGLIAPATLRLVVQPQDGSPKFEPVDVDVALSICSPEATALRSEWLKSLEIVLFDPAEKTKDVFERSRIPCRVANDPNCAELTNGLILYGEGIEPARLDAVWVAAIEAASTGRRVLVMSSPGASVLAETLLATTDDSMTSVSLLRKNAILELDKRLDSSVWPKPGRLVSSSLHLTAQREQPRIEFRDDVEGWTWLQARYRNGGRLTWLGFGITESWDATPTPRYLLLNVLENLSSDKLVVEGK